MTQQMIAPVRKVVGVIKTKAQAETGWVFEVDIPEFKSQFLTKLTRVPDATAAVLILGKSYNLPLEQQRLKPAGPNAKRIPDGTYPSDYYWGLISEAEYTKRLAAQPAEPAPVAQGATPSGAEAAAGPTEAPTPVDWRDGERQSIEAQVVLKAAQQATEWLMTKYTVGREPAEWANEYMKWLRDFQKEISVHVEVPK